MSSSSTVSRRTMTNLQRHSLQVDNSPCVLEILDTAGTEQFASMRDLYIKNGHGFIVMYSLTNHQTFQDITTMRNVISRVKGSQPVPILLVANKLDLECQREVSTEEGECLCLNPDKRISFLILPSAYFRSRTGRDVGLSIYRSICQNRINVNEVFSIIVREMNMTMEKRQKKSFCCCL